jgi:L-rhamnose mutarotase
MTIALHSVLREGCEAAYDDEHRAVWPDLLAALQKAGIDEWRIWRSGRHLFHLVETGDFERAMARLADDPVNQRWQAHINTIVDHFEEGPSGMPLQFVWSLAEQASQAS